MSLFGPWISSRGWKALWVAIRRSHRDAHARKNLLQLAFSLVVALLYLCWYFFYFRGLLGTDRITGITSLGVLIGAILLMTYGTVQEKWEKRKLEQDDPAVKVDLRISLHREACLWALLLERLGSEIGMEKEHPANIEIITRRVQLEKLEALGLRDDLDPFLLDVLLAPDGHWQRELKIRAQNAWECLSSFRWVLGLGELRPLVSEAKYSYVDTQSVLGVKDPAKLYVMPAWDVRPARNETDIFFSRCWSELIARGEISDTSEQDVAQALHKRSSILAEGYTADYLIGTQTIPELPSPILWSAVIRAYNRWQVLSLLVEVISGEVPVSELRTLLAQFFSVSSTEEAAR
jgi:hypothetical protein